MFTFDPLGTPIVIRSPDFGNGIRLNNNDIRRFSRNGDQLQYASTDWAKFKYRTYQFSVITKTLMDAVKQFLLDNAGLQITITDHLGETLTGYITSPINEIIAVRPDCSYSFSFDFMEEPT